MYIYSIVLHCIVLYCWYYRPWASHGWLQKLLGPVGRGFFLWAVAWRGCVGSESFRRFPKRDMMWHRYKFDVVYLHKIFVGQILCAWFLSVLMPVLEETPVVHGTSIPPAPNKCGVYNCSIFSAPQFPDSPFCSFSILSVTMATKHFWMFGNPVVSHPWPPFFLFYCRVRCRSL